MSKFSVKLLPIGAVTIALLMFAAPFANASLTEFTFTGTITSFSATQLMGGPLPNLANAGDPFIGTAFFNDDPDLRFGDGFTIYVGGLSLVGGSSFIGGPGQVQYSFLTPDQLFIDIKSVSFGGPYSTSATAFGSNLSLSLADGTGSFKYDGDNLIGTTVDIFGDITSVTIVPDTTSSLWLAPPAIFLIGAKRFRFLRAARRV